MDLNKVYLFRMIHIDNITHVLQYGITHRLSPNRNPYFKPIGDNSLIGNRDNFILPNGQTLGQFIPFYFGSRMPMLYVIQKGFNNVTATPAESIIYIISSIQKLLDLKISFLFSDGHAVNGLSSFYDKNDINKLGKILDFEAINTKFWKNEDDLDLKRRKEAELLLAEDLPEEGILGFVVYNEKAKLALQSLGVEKDKIAIRPNFYF